jgi:hypothetical protein
VKGPSISQLQDRNISGNSTARGYFRTSPSSSTSCTTPNDLQRRRAMRLLKIKIASKNMREKPTNKTIINSSY